MSQGDPTVETARISARQAITVALITGIVSIFTTLIATGNLGSRRSEGTAAGAGSTTMPAGVLDAPHLFFSARTVDLSLGDCMEKGRNALNSGKFTGITARQNFSWGYRQENIGGVWCHTDVRQVIFLAAGKNETTAEGTRAILERSY